MLNHRIAGLIFLSLFMAVTTQAQLLNLPNGASDIGTNSSGTGVGIGTNTPAYPLHIYNNNANLTLHGQQNHLPTSSAGIRLKDDRSVNDFLLERSFFPNWGTGGVHLSFSGKKGIHFMDNLDEIRFSTQSWATSYNPYNGPVAPFRFDDLVAMPSLVVGTTYGTPGGPANFSIPTGFGLAVQHPAYFKSKAIVSDSLIVNGVASFSKDINIGDGPDVIRMILKGPDNNMASAQITFKDGSGYSCFNLKHDAAADRFYINSPESNNMLVLNRLNGNIGMNSLPSGAAKLKIVSGFSGSVLVGLSGSNANSSTVNIGREITELTMASVAVNGHYSTDALVGDFVVRTEDSDKKLIFNNGTGSSSLVVQKDKIGIGVASNIADRLHVHNGVARISGTEAAVDIATPGLRLGSHSSNYSWIQSSKAPLALNPNSGTYVAIGFDPLDPNITLPDPQDNYKLMVKGKMLVEEVKVRLAANWPDYVFAPDYKLTPLEEVESFIQENRHLPQVPSAATVEKEGFELAAMNALLLQKVEELTLYLIEQNKKMEALEKRLERVEE